MNYSLKEMTSRKWRILLTAPSVLMAVMTGIFMFQGDVSLEQPGGLLERDEQPVKEHLALSVTEAQREIWQFAIASAQEIADPDVKESLFLQLIEALSQGEEIDLALTLLPQLQRQHSRLEGISSIAQGYLHQQEWDLALEQLQEAFTIRQSASEEAFFIDYDQEVFQDLVVQWANQGEIDKALAVSDLIAVDLYRARALNGIVSQLLAQNQPEFAEEILNRALPIAQQISETRYDYSANGSCANYKYELFAEIGENLRQLSQWREARKIAQSVKGCYAMSFGLFKPYQAEEFLALIEATDNLKNLEEIWQSTQDIQENFEKLPVWKALAIKLIQQGQIDFGVTIAQQLSQEIPSITEITSDYELFHFNVKENAIAEIAFTLAEVGQLDLALAFIAEINHPLQPEGQDLALIPIANLLKSQGKIAQSQQILTQLQFPQLPLSPLAENHSLSLFNSLPPLSAVASELIKIGEEVYIFRQLPTEESAKTEILNGVVIGLTEQQEFAKAFQVAQDYNLKGKPLLDIAFKVLDKDEQNWRLALNIAQYLPEPEEQEWILRQVIPHIKSSVELEQVLQSFNLEKNKLSEIDNVYLLEVITQQWMTLNESKFLFNQIQEIENLQSQLKFLKIIVPDLETEAEATTAESILKSVTSEIKFSEPDFQLTRQLSQDCIILLAQQWIKLHQENRALALESNLIAGENDYIPVDLFFLSKIIPLLRQSPVLNQLSETLQKRQQETETALLTLTLSSTEEEELKQLMNHYQDRFRQLALRWVELGEIENAIALVNQMRKPEEKTRLLLDLAQAISASNHD